MGLWSGIPERIDFLGDEIVPTDVFDAIATDFSNGWWAWYPPVHYYVLTVAYSPFLLLDWLGRIDTLSRFWYDLLSVITRLVSLAEGLGILIAIYCAASKRFRSGLVCLPPPRWRHRPVCHVHEGGEYRDPLCLLVRGVSAVFPPCAADRAPS